MRKNDLIKYLQGIKGNPEILLWNGLVGDWADISKEFVESSLVKETLQGYIEACRLEECITRKDWEFNFSPDDLTEIISCHRNNSKWECNQFVTSEDVKEGRYKKKRVVYIQPKLRGETTYDRLGSINY